MVFEVGQFNGDIYTYP